VPEADIFSVRGHCKGVDHAARTLSRNFSTSSLRWILTFDGSKFKAVNTRDRNFTQAKMQRRLAQIDESIARYLSQLDSADRQGEAVPEAKTTRLNEKIATLRQEIQRLNALNTQMMQAEDTRAACSITPELNSLDCDLI
jgi:hypothetical protein